LTLKPWRVYKQLALPLAMLRARSPSPEARSFMRGSAASRNDAGSEEEADEEEALSDENTAASAQEAESLSCLGDVAKGIIGCSKCVIFFWLVLSIACIPGACRFTSVLKINAGSPAGSGAAIAEAAFKKHFPPHGLTAQYVGYIETEQPSILEVPGVADFSRELQRRLNRSRPLTSFMSLTRYQDLTAPLGMNAPEMPIPMWSKDNKALILSWATADDATSTEAITWAMGPMHDIFMAAVPEILGGAISFYGTTSYSEAAGQAVPVAEADMLRVDLLCIPVTAAVLYLLVQSFRLLLIPGATLGVAAVVSYAALFVLGCYVPVMPATPGLMSCLMISVSIDYAIFLLVRFREELPERSLRRRRDENDDWDEAIEAAICTTMSTSGATILLSGFVLLLAFLFMSFFPITIIASMGMGACMSMTIMMLVNLTLVPALLSEFRVFFTSDVTKKETGPKARSCSDKFWKAIAGTVTTFPCNLLCLLSVVGLTLTVAYPIFHMQTSGDLRQILGLGSRIAKVSNLVSEKFGGGMAFPVEVLMIPSDSRVSILSKEFFTQSAGFVQALERHVHESMPEAAASTFSFLTYQTGRGQAVEFDDLDTLCEIKKTQNLGPEWVKEHFPVHLGSHLGIGRLAVRGITFGADLRPLCAFFINAATNTPDYTSAGATATYGVIMPSIEPLGKSGQKFLDTLRMAYQVEGPKYGITAWFGGDAVKNLDMVSALYGTFPNAIIATAITAGLFLTLAFRSLIIPLRSLLSVLLTLGFTYGFTVLTYQYGLLDFLGMAGVNSKFKSLPWCAPVIVFFIIFGIALDYDIFLCVRITELRAKGYSPEDAVREGLERTGGVIMAAGLVMACAFSGILFSSMFQQAMFGFMISIAVLYDTFIALSIVTPAGMSLLGRSNWWPSKLSIADEADSSQSCSDIEDEE